MGWSTHTRGALNIEMQDYEAADYRSTPLSQCLAGNEVFQAASTLRNGVKNILHNASYVGFSKSTPNVFLLAYGIVEAVLYSVRLFDALTAHAAHASFLQPATALAATRRVSEIEEGLSYDADRLVRSLSVFEARMDEAHRDAMETAVSGSTCLIENFDMSMVAARYASVCFRCIFCLSVCALILMVNGGIIMILFVCGDELQIFPSYRCRNTCVLASTGRRRHLLRGSCPCWSYIAKQWSCHASAGPGHLAADW